MAFRTFQPSEFIDLESIYPQGSLVPLNDGTVVNSDGIHTVRWHKENNMFLITGTAVQLDLLYVTEIDITSPPNNTPTVFQLSGIVISDLFDIVGSARDAQGNMYPIGYGDSSGIHYNVILNSNRSSFTVNCAGFSDEPARIRFIYR